MATERKEDVEKFGRVIVAEGAYEYARLMRRVEVEASHAAVQNALTKLMELFSELADLGARKATANISDILAIKKAAEQIYQDGVPGAVHTVSRRSGYDHDELSDLLYNDISHSLDMVYDTSSRIHTLSRILIKKALTDLSHLDIDQRVTDFFAYVRQNEGADPLLTMQEVFPELWADRVRPTPTAPTETAVPDTAPTLWADRATAEGGVGRHENPVEFTKRVYATWIENGDLTRPALRRLDPKLYQALATWTKRHGEDGLHLPTASELNDRLLEQIGSGQLPDGGVSARDLERLGSAGRRRAKKTETPVR